MKQRSRSISRGWLVRLRLGAAASKLAIALVVHFALGIALPIAAICVLVAIEALSNVLLRSREPTLSPRVVLGVMALDIGLLTGLLHLTGGASNPFSFVYLIYLSLASASLPVRWSWGLAGLTAACSASLFIAPVDMHHGHREMLLHLRGMWVAFIVAGGFIVVFVNRLRHELDAQNEHLDRARRLASVTTLAAGAAHELSTPLNTIAVAAGELRHIVSDPDVIEDVELIRQQVQRCSEILGQLGADSGEVIGEMPQPTTLREIVDPLAAEHPRLVVELEDDSAQRLPLRAMRRVLLSLVENAEQASRDDAPVTLRARPLADDQVEIVVEDEGEGMPAEVLAHARDPFFTTKSEGLGLGLFLASAVVEQLGGTLELDTTPREGTRVRIRYPRLALEGNVSSPRHHR